MAVGMKYGNLINGFEDSFLERVVDRKPIPERVRSKIHGVSPEFLVFMPQGGRGP